MLSRHDDIDVAAILVDLDAIELRAVACLDAAGGLAESVLRTGFEAARLLAASIEKAFPPLPERPGLLMLLDRRMLGNVERDVGPG